MEIVYCKKCHLKKKSKDFNEVLNKIKEIRSVDEVTEGCVSSCGYGKNKFIIEIDYEMHAYDSLEEMYNDLEEK